MDKMYVCPFCGLERDQKKQMDFHLKYGHSEIFEFMRKEASKADIEKKLKELEEQKNLLNKNIKIMKNLIEQKQDDA
ncbi:MAG: hypothetical protein NWE89_08640 [Candidatus Bathyarchaeota archaeon]|nr:hypothetical protein [Candidatus Bathyarchaeota archaeon]